jgi:hypothetical protein
MGISMKYQWGYNGGLVDIYNELVTRKGLISILDIIDIYIYIIIYIYNNNNKNLWTYNTHQPNSLRAFTLGLARKKSVDGGNRDTETEGLFLGRGARSASLLLNFKFYKPFYYIRVYKYIYIFIQCIYIYIHRI